MVSADDDDSSQNCIITRKSNDGTFPLALISQILNYSDTFYYFTERRKWTTEMILTLLHLRHQADNRFKENFQNTFYLWKELASQMSERLMTDFSTSELESVWNHCVITYEINLENLKSKGVDTIKWRYFAVIDELLGGTSEISDICVPRPGENLLKKFRKLQMRSDSLRASTLPENEPLWYSIFLPLLRIHLRILTKFMFQFHHHSTCHNWRRKRQRRQWVHPLRHPLDQRHGQNANLPQETNQRRNRQQQAIPQTSMARHSSSLPFFKKYQNHRRSMRRKMAQFTQNLQKEPPARQNSRNRRQMAIFLENARNRRQHSNAG